MHLRPNVWGLRDIRPGRRNQALCLVASLALIATVAPSSLWAQEKDDDRQITDQNLTRVTKERLSKAGDELKQVEVNTEQHIVNLTGSVPTLEAREHAESIAKRIRGVMTVDNRIKVRPSGRTDEQIRDEVKAALDERSSMKDFPSDLKAEVSDGVVTLTGQATSRRMADFAAESIRGVRGVRQIQNKIEIGGETLAERTDDQIGGRIMARINSDEALHNAQLQATVKDRLVTLSGVVGSAAAKDRAIRDVQVLGVRAIDASGLKVRWRSEDGSSHAAAAKSKARSDEQIQADVRATLEEEPWLRGTEPKVAVRNGEVTLSGNVPTLRAKWAAQQAARDVSGVRKVRDDLTVENSSKISSETIAQNVEGILERDAYLGNNKITITATGNNVRLRGNVDSEYEARRAGRLTSGVMGVSTVQNELTVNGQPFKASGSSWLPNHYHPFAWLSGWNRDRSKPSDDATILKDIENQLFWSPFVDRDQVHVKVENGVATLSGMVDTWGEHGAAIENAYEGGAREVRDELKVAQGAAPDRP
jgi:osmotically-inducible protein OsmY